MIKINKNEIVLLEEVEAEATRWGISLAGPNPEPEDYIECSTKDDAVALKNYVSVLPEKDLSCPFCGESDFDYIGLRGHLLLYCPIYRGM